MTQQQRHREELRVVGGWQTTGRTDQRIEVIADVEFVEEGVHQRSRQGQTCCLSRDLDDPTDPSHAGLFRGFILRNSDVGAAALTLDVFLFRAVCGNHIIWGFQHVVGFRRRHVGASIQDAWTTSLESVRGALDADAAHDRLVLLRATSQELGPTRDAVVDAVVQRLDLSQKQAAEAYTLAEVHETNPRSVWGYVQGLTRLSQRTPWQDGRFSLDRAASRLLTTVH